MKTEFEKKIEAKEIIMDALIEATKKMEGREIYDTPIVELQIIADKVTEQLIKL